MPNNLISKPILFSLGIALNLNLHSVQATSLTDQMHEETQKLLKKYEAGEFDEQSLYPVTDRISNTPEATIASPPSMDELSKRFFLIHKTTKVPNGDTLYPAGKDTPYNHSLQEPTCPFSLHWSAFSDFEWREGAYNIGILSPFDKLKNQIVIVSMAEIATLGPYKLGKEDYLLVPEGVPTPNLPTTLLKYPATKNLTQAIQDSLKDHNLFCIRSVPKQSEYEWEERDGIIDGVSQASPKTFFDNFFKMYPYVSLGSEGGIKTGQWDCLALANHYPHIAHRSLSDKNKAFKLNKWFFDLYSEILDRLTVLADKHQLPTSQFVKNRAEAILSDIKQYESEDIKEVEFSESVFKVALYAKFANLYKQLKRSKGSLEAIEVKEREELVKLWTLIYPSIPITDLSKLMISAEQIQ